jgi:hypothetical protein
MESKAYRRPDSQWKCGRACDGVGCPQGPDAQGRCLSQQCHPKRTLRWWRSYLPVAFGTATLAIVVSLVVSEKHREVIAPGPLSLAHAQLIHDPSDPHRCASCHEDSASPFSNSIMDNDVAAAHTQTQRCMACHLRELPQLKRSTPHDLTLAQLQSLTAASKSQSIAQVSFVKNQPIDWHQHQLACSDCHREHQGAEHNLQTISSQRCQACHQNQFNAFADGHPEFSNYPDPSSGQIAFDHARHRDLHFSKSSTEFDCRKCHVNGAEQGRVGQVFRSVAFESACAACHAAPMKSSLSDGIIVFQLPSIDLQQLAQHGSPIANWPSEAGQLFDGSIPPWMQWLLMSDEDASHFFEKRPDGGRLTEFHVDRAEDRQAIVKLATASQRLLSQLASGGQAEFQQRLIAALETKDTDLTTKLVRGIPPDLFRQAYHDWFEKNTVPNGLSVSAKGNVRMVADRRDLRDVNDAKEGNDGKALENATSNNELLSSGNDLLSNSSDSLVDNSLLMEKPLASDLLSSDSLDSSGLDSVTSSAPESSSDWKPLKPIKHLEGGGWMIDRQRMAIVYIPSGHADPWLTAMLTFASHAKDANGNSAANGSDPQKKSHWETMTKSILAKDGVGRCLECHHGVQAANSSSRTEATPVAYQTTSPEDIHASWKADRFDVRVRQITRFDHGPHLLQPSLTSCVACHRMVASHAVASHLPHRDFESMAVKDCASCHQPKAAGDNCTQCHNYHTNGIER